MRKINRLALNLIKGFETERLSAYQDFAGVWTIGYGHTAGVYPGQNITKEQAEELLLRDLDHFETGVCCQITVPLTDNQFGAVVSLTFNIGLDNLLDSTLRKKLNEGKYEEAANWFLPWCKSHDKKTGKLVELDGLVDRRRAEMKLFLTPDEKDPKA